MVEAQVTPTQAPTQKPERSPGKKIIVLIPMGIPGIGKSTLFKSLLGDKSIQETFDISTISSDEVKKEVMDKFLTNNPDKTEDDAFRSTAKQYKSLFVSQLKQATQKKLDEDKLNQLIIVDKNHPINALNLTVENICKNSPKDSVIYFIGIVPSCKNQITLNGNRYPFSYASVIQSINRTCKRTEHATLTNVDKLKAIQICSLFTTFYKDVKIDISTFNRHYINSLVEIDFTNEAIEEKLSDEFKEVIAQLLKNKGNEKTSQEACLRLLEKNEKLLNEEADINVMKEKLKKSVMEGLGKCSNDASWVVEEEGKKSKKSKKKKKKRGKMEKEVEENVGEPKEESKVWETKEESEGRDPKEERKEEIAEKGRKKVPLFISLQTRGNTETRDKILEAIYFGNSQMLEEYGGREDSKEIIALQSMIEEGRITNYSSPWKYPASWHLTLLYLGKAPDQPTLQNPIFTNFQPGLQRLLTIQALVVVPGYILFGLAFPKDQCHNPIPHVTLLLAKYRAEKANLVAGALFGAGGKLEREYVRGEFQDKQKGYITSVNLQLENDSMTCFVFKLIPGLELPAKTSN